MLILSAEEKKSQNMDHPENKNHKNMDDNLKNSKTE